MSGYCPEHDPILRAGSLSCDGCGAESWPADAEWITGTLVLATFAAGHEPGCAAPRGFPGTVLLDLGQGDRTVAPVQRPRLCRATAASTGRQCRGRACPGSGYCRSHDPARGEA